MICPNCGRPIPDGQPCPYCGVQPAYSSNPAVNVLKRVGASGVFLAAVICFTLGTVLNVFASGEANNTMDALLQTLVRTGAVDPELYYQMMGAMSTSTIVGAVIGAAPGILIVVALWITCISCRNRTTGNVSTAGLTICKVLTVIKLVMLIIVAALLVILMILAFAAGGMAYAEADDVAFYMGFMVGFFLVLAVTLALAICFSVSTLRTINRIRGTALTGMPDNRISRFLTVMLILSAACSILLGIWSVGDTPVATLAMLCTSVGEILIAMALNRYRREMTALMMPAPMADGYPMPPQQ